MGLCVARSMFVIDRPRRGERDIVISRASDRRARKTDRCDHLRYCWGLLSPPESCTTENVSRKRLDGRSQAFSMARIRPTVWNGWNL